MTLISEAIIPCNGETTHVALLKRLEVLRRESLEMKDRRKYRRLSRVIEKVKSNPDLVYCEDVKVLMKQLKY